MKRYSLRYRWGVSRGRDTCGYTTCSLFVNGDRVAACNGGGYDMRGTVLGIWIANTFPDLLNKLSKEFYGLTFHDPNFDPGKAVIKDGETVEDREKSGKSLGLERYQQFYKASSPVGTKNHTVPSIDGACGVQCVETIFRAIGGEMRFVHKDSKHSIYEAELPDAA